MDKPSEVVELPVDPKERRNKLRALTVGSKKQFKAELFEIDGEQFEVRAPSVRHRSAILSAANVSKDQSNPKLDIASLHVEAIIRMTYVPGTDERVFSHEDREALMSAPVGSYVDDLAEVCMKMANIGKDDVGKNSETIPSDSSSST